MSVVTIALKELRLYFTSFLFYALAFVFLALAGYSFYGNLEYFVLLGGMNLPLGLWQYQFFDVRQILLVMVPLLTMRLLAEERKQGTLELLWTYPLRDGEIVLGKFLACLAVLTLVIGVTALYPVVLATLYPTDPGPLVAGYLGLWLLTAACVACGLFLSSLTDSQLVAGTSTFGLLFLFWILTWNEAAVGGGLLAFLKPLSLFDRFEIFARGGVDTKDVSFFVLFTTAFLGFTFLVLDSRRWRGMR
jgi:ABC-2 type transport system permease protein